MAERNLIRRIIAIFDRDSHTKAEKETEASLGRAGKKGGEALERELKKAGGTGETVFGKLRAAALRLGAAMAAAFTVRKIVEFGKAAVQAATESELVWRNLAGTVQAAGVAFEEVEPQLRAAADEFERLTTFDDDQYAATLQRLIALTNDYAASVANVGLVADVAARFFEGDLAPAVDLVGRAMAGNLRGLKQLGIDATTAQEALDELARRSMGAAAERAATLAGKVQQLNNAWGNFKEAVGEAITQAGGGTRAIDVLIAAVRAMTRWVTQNAGAIQHLGSILGWLTEHVFARTLSLGFLPLLSVLTLVSNAYALWLRGIALAGQALGFNTAAIDAHIKKIDELAAAVTKLTVATGKTVILGAQIPGAPTTPGSGGTPPPPVPPPVDDGLDDVVDKNAEAAEEVQTVWGEAVKKVEQETMAQQSLFEQLGEAWREGGFAGIAALAKAKVKENLASALESGARALAAFALGNQKAAALFGKSALQHGIAAAAWRGLAGGGGGGGGGSGGDSGGSVAAGGPAAGIDRAGSAQPPGTEVHIYFDPLDPRDPRVQEFHHETGRMVSERFGENATVTYHPRTTR